MNPHRQYNQIGFRIEPHQQDLKYQLWCHLQAQIQIAGDERLL